MAPWAMSCVRARAREQNKLTRPPRSSDRPPSTCEGGRSAHAPLRRPQSHLFVFLFCVGEWVGEREHVSVCVCECVCVRVRACNKQQNKQTRWGRGRGALCAPPPPPPVTLCVWMGLAEEEECVFVCC